MRCSHLLSVFVLSAGLLAQVPVPVPQPPLPPGPQNFPAALRLFLDLTDVQVRTILDLNFEYQRFAVSKARRMGQVQQEIVEETARAPLDPMALGLRYVELEAIRRELQTEQTRLRNRLQQALTDPQRAKLRALEEIIKMLPIYSEAAQVNLLEPLGQPGFGRVGSVFIGEADPLPPPNTPQ